MAEHKTKPSKIAVGEFSLGVYLTFWGFKAAPN